MCHLFKLRILTLLSWIALPVGWLWVILFNVWFKNWWLTWKFKQLGGRKRPILLDESRSEDTAEPEGAKGMTTSGGKKHVKPQKRLTKRRKTTNDKPTISDKTSSDDFDSDNSPQSDGKTAYKKVKEAQEKRGQIRKGPQSNTLRHFSTPKATLSGAEKRWSFKCKYCSRWALLTSFSTWTQHLITVLLS